LKTLLLLTYTNKHFEKIRKAVPAGRQENNTFYHHPLLLTLVNSVDTKKSDLKLFFSELEKIAVKEIRPGLLQTAKRELVQEFSNYPKFTIEEGLDCSINLDLISKLGYKDVLRHILNAKTPGNIEVLKIPGNRKELIFKLKTAEKPFALIKIGDISGWLKEKLEGYEINESFENESYFKRINRDDSDINILMGSRSFYEGWDSNRPNLLLFVNIGVGKDAKKFVLQSVGRGVRIEPIKNKRKRLQNLFNAKEVKEQLFDKVKSLILPIESLFVFGTNAENLKKIIATLKTEKEDKNLGDAFIVNPETQGKTLLIPVYKESEKIFADEQQPQPYCISRDDFKLTKKFSEFLGDKISLVKYNCEVKVLKKAKESFEEEERYYDFSERNSLSEPELILDRIFDYLGIRSKEFEKFKELENEIVHFKKVRFRDGEKYNEIKKKIEEMKQFPERQKELDKQYGKIPREEFTRQMNLFEKAGNFELKNQKIKIKYLANHYYLPVIVSETEKIDYINHIINVDSEIRFIEKLEKYLTKPDNIFAQSDWWMFSKIDQTLDEVHIPYYNQNEGKISNFYPDFVFWLKKGDRYLIVFVDPKASVYSNANYKIDGYKKLFEENKKTKIFPDGKTVKLFMWGKNNTGTEYESYWTNNFTDFAAKVNK